MMKKISVFIALFFIAGFLSAQNNDETAVYLKNGSVFVGKILKYDQGGEIKIKIDENITLNFTEDQIKKVVQLKVKNYEHNNLMKDAGWFNETEVNLGYGMDFRENVVGDMGLLNTTGFQFNRYFGVGLGVGITNHGLSPHDARMIPVFVEFRSIPIDKAEKLVFAIKAGYGFAWKTSDIDTEEGGLMFNPQIRYRFSGGKSIKSDFAFSVGYLSQNYSYALDNTYDIWYWGRSGNTSRYEMVMRRINIGFHVNFWR